MIRSANEMRTAARASLSGKWGGAVVVTLVYMVVAGGFPLAVNVCVLENLGSVLQLLLLPIGYGLAVAFLDNNRDGGEYRVEQLFVGFRDYTRIFGTSLLVGVYTFLWTLLLIVPGFIKSYSYAMTSYVMRDCPELKFNGAIERSMAMMRGHKFDLFYLHLTFIGWFLLSILTLGIGFFWLGPYVQSAQAHFYEDVKAEYEDRQGEAA